MISKIEAIGIYATTQARGYRDALVVTDEVYADMGRMVEAIGSIYGTGNIIARAGRRADVRFDSGLRFSFCGRVDVDHTLRGRNGLVFLAVPLSSLTDATLASLAFNKTEYLR